MLGGCARRPNSPMGFGSSLLTGEMLGGNATTHERVASLRRRSRSRSDLAIGSARCLPITFLATSPSMRRDGESRRLHTLALDLSRADGDDQGIATSLGSIALVDVAEGDFNAARGHFDAAIAAYESAEMPDAAIALRDMATDLLERRVSLEAVIHRVAHPDRQGRP